MPDPTLNIAGTSHYALAQSHAVKPPASVPPVEDAQTGQPSIDLSYRGDPQSNGAQRRHFDESTIAGPPPTFEASLLELERDIDLALRRLEARREHGNEARPPVNQGERRAERQEQPGATEQAHESHAAHEVETTPDAGVEGTPPEAEALQK